MDNLQALRQQVRRHLAVTMFIENAFLIAAYWFATTHTSYQPWLIATVMLLVGFILTVIITDQVSKYVIEPVRALWQTILHISPEGNEPTAAPQIEQLRLGRELVANLAGQVYQLANVSANLEATSAKERTNLKHNFIADNLPLPLFVLDEKEAIAFANHAACEYIGLKPADMISKNIYTLLDMSFPSEATFDNWLKTAQHDAVTATNSWQRVRLNARDSQPLRLFDLAAYYNKGNAEDIATLLVLFDHTKEYSQDEQAVGFMALSVHELRTPLTLLRGYIEVFDEELAGKLTPELDDFMEKMKATSEQLTAFVNNILNVARVDDDQLELKLQQEDWSSVLKNAVDMVSLRAKVRGIAIECSIAGGLPPVGVDRLSIQEVINNLVDNAIKYSGSSTKIKIDAKLNPDGLVETTVQDFGVGIPTSLLPNLFTKFYRDHHNRAQVGGTGLGLYLSKAIITAHGGNLWVRSKEGEGSTFGFTIVPYSQLASDVKDKNSEIVREAHGWIKNHSLYRR